MTGVPAESAPMVRSVSAEVAGVTGTTREIARRALDAVGGHVPTAIMNLMSNSLDPSGPDPVAALAEKELVEFAGVSSELARRHLVEAGGDLEAAKRALLAAVIGEAEAREAGSTEDYVREAKHAAPLLANTDSFECPACMDDVETGDGMLIRACGHPVCRECATAHVDALMRDGETIITCPHGDCREALDQRELRALVGTSKFSILDRRALEAAVLADPSLHMCPTADCTFVTSWVGPDDGLPMCDCPNCGKKSCLVCGMSPYHKDRTCEEAKVERDAERGGAGGDAAEAAYEAYLRRSNIRKCARCGCGVVKESGVRDMRLPPPTSARFAVLTRCMMFAVQQDEVQVRLQVLL